MLRWQNQEDGELHSSIWRDSPNSSRFLLRYATRDEIVLLGRGNGGIVEIRNAIANYEEVSPLFGFLRYRRRNVVIKYVPEDCSRLVQGESLCSCIETCGTFANSLKQHALQSTSTQLPNDSPLTIPSSLSPLQKNFGTPHSPPHARYIPPPAPHLRRLALCGDAV